MYLRASCQQAVDQLWLRELNQEWDAIDIVSDIGINENTIQLLCSSDSSDSRGQPRTLACGVIPDLWAVACTAVQLGCSG